MSDLTFARRMAWAIWTLEIGLVVIGLALLWLNRSTFPSGGMTPVLITAVSVLAYGTMGALILARQPRHPIGWLFCALALPQALQFVAQEYAILGYLVARANWPALRLAAWLQAWVNYLSFPSSIALPYLLFPSGRLPSPRWRWLVGVIVLAAGMNVVLPILTPGFIYVYRGDEAFSLPVSNPTGWAVRPPAFAAVLGQSWTLAILAYLAAIVAGLVRYRRARGDERQQLKWFAYFAALSLLILLLSVFGSLVPAVGEVAWVRAFDELGLVVVTIGAPVAAGIAILRYRLYDIDQIINRTLVYGLLTAALSLIYFGSVAVLQRVFVSQSPLVLVASTLLIAVLFAPLRARLQATIDRRFHRRRYDAQRVLQAFSATIRDEVNVDRLSDAFQAVVQQVVEPTAISLWLRHRPPQP